MTPTNPLHAGWYLRRRTWIVLLLNGILMSVGCSPNTLAMFCAPWVDNKLPPEYKIIGAKKEPTVVIMASFSRPEDRPEVLPADGELAEQVGQHVRLRCQANKDKIKVIPSAQVRSYQNKLSARNGATPAEVGKHFSADYVIQLEITSLNLYERKSFGQLYQGSADIALSVYDLSKPEDERKVYDKPFRCDFPTSAPREASSCSEVQFRSFFMAKLGREISKLFIAYPADERTEME